MESSTDFTANNGTTFVLAAPASTGDLLESVAYKVASVVVTTGNFTVKHLWYCNGWYINWSYLSSSG